MQSNSVETGSSQFTDENLQQNLHYIFFLHLLASACVLCTGLDSKAYYLFYTKSKVYWEDIIIAMPASSNWFKSVFTNGHLQQNLLYIFFFFCISLLLHVYWP